MNDILELVSGKLFIERVLGFYYTMCPDCFIYRYKHTDILFLVVRLLELES